MKTLKDKRKEIIHKFRSSGMDFLEFVKEIKKQDKDFIKDLKLIFYAGNSHEKIDKLAGDL